MLLDVLAIVGDAAGSNAGFSHELEADLPTQVIWDLSLLHNIRMNRQSCLMYNYLEQDSGPMIFQRVWSDCQKCLEVVVSF